MKIRPERAEDRAAIGAVHVAAFANHPFSHQTEHLIVGALRADDALAVSLAAEAEGTVVGHVAFSPVSIDGTFRRWYGAGPAGVLPAYQRKGIGSALMRAGLEALRALGGEGCVLVGDPAFYLRFGFRPRAELVLEGVPPEVFLSLPFSAEIPVGNVAFHPAFAVER